MEAWQGREEVERSGRSPESRRTPPGSGWGFVRGPLTDDQEAAIRRARDSKWWPSIRRAVAWYIAHPRPGSRVDPKWVPVQWLADLFAEHLDPDALAVEIMSMARYDDLVERTMVLGGRLVPVVSLADGAPLPEIVDAVRLPGGAVLAFNHTKEIGP
jgi:hypothetical protein